MAVSKEQFREALGLFATGVTVITVATQEDQVHGMTANAFSSVSLDPLLVLVCIDHKARTHPLVHARMRFGVNVLAEDQQAIAEYYARVEPDHESAHRLGVHYRLTERGTPMLAGCLANLECRVVSTHIAGDHTIFIGQVERVEIREGRPLLFYSGNYERLESGRGK